MFTKSIPVILGLLLISCKGENKDEIIQSYFDVHNAHDIEKSLSYFGDEIEFELKGVWVKKGLDDMRSLEEWDAGMKSQLKLKSARIAGDTVYCKVVESNDWFRTIGVQELNHDPVIFVMEDGKFKNIIAFPSQETGMKVEAAVGKIFEWSAKTGDSTVYGLIRDGQFVYSTEAAEEWLDLFERMGDSVNFQ